MQPQREHTTAKARWREETAKVKRQLYIFLRASFASSRLRGRMKNPIWGGNQSADGSVSVTGLNAWVYAHPFEDSVAGGDVYYVSSCATGRITRLLLADVSGHGAKVADTALALRSLMRKFINWRLVFFAS